MLSIAWCMRGMPPWVPLVPGQGCDEAAETDEGRCWTLGREATAYADDMGGSQLIPHKSRGYLHWEDDAIGCTMPEANASEGTPVPSGVAADGDAQRKVSRNTDKLIDRVEHGEATVMRAEGIVVSSK